MQRLIDAGELSVQLLGMVMDKMILFGHDAAENSRERFALAMIAQAPTVDAIPIDYMRSQVDSGKWEEIITRWKEHAEREEE